MSKPSKGFHPKTLELMRKLGVPNLPKLCVACNGTGRNSNGGLCYPCLVKAKKEKS